MVDVAKEVRESSLLVASVFPVKQEAGLSADRIRKGTEEKKV